MTSSNSIPVIMKAVFLQKQGGTLVVREVKTPVPGPGEVLIKIAAAPVNPSDLAGIRNAHKRFDPETFIPGLEGSGTVVSTGKGILPRLWKGKRVACSAKYHTSGTWAEYMVSPAALCFPLSKKVTDEQGSMSLVNPLTALSFLEIVKKGRHKALINNAAAGALGRMVELLCKMKGVPVINIVRNQSQADLLRSAGSPYVLDSSTPDFLENLRDLSLKLNATILFDSVCGNNLGNIIEALPHGSSVVIYGNLTLAETIKVNPRSLIDNDIRITGFYLGSRSKENGMVKNLLNLMEVSRLMSSNMKIKISNRFPLINVQEAVDFYLGNMTAGKVILVP